MIRRVKNKAKQVGTYFVMLLCGSVTVYIFAASYELVFNHDLPFISAVNAVNITSLSRVILPYSEVDQTDLGNYGRPQFMKIPARTTKVTLAPGINTGDNFLARANTGHYLLTTSPRNGQIGDMAIYLRSSWRTFTGAEGLKPGDNIFLDTDRDWRYFYRVNSVKEISPGDAYVSRDIPASKLTILSVTEGSNRSTIIEAALINVQNVRL